MIYVTRAVRLPLLLLMVLVCSAGPLAADQGVARTPPARQAPAPAPKTSPLYKPAAPETPTIAEAQKADAASREGATISMSNTALILVIVILVVLLVT